MVYITICLLLVLGMALSGCGKSKSGRDNPVKHMPLSDGPTSALSRDKDYFENLKEEAESDNSDEASPENGEEAGDNNSVEEADTKWKEAYIAVLNEARKFDVDNAEALGYEKTPYQYTVYDIDKDGVPELIVEFGTCEADFNGKLYKYENGQAVMKEEFSLGHTCFYSVPNENGILFYWGHMGYAYLQKATMDANGQLSYEELLSEELDPNTDDYYTNPSMVVPGSCYVSMCRMELDIYINNYEKITAQINELPEPPEESEIIPNYIEEIVPDIMEHNGKVYAASADGYGGDLGPDTEIEYLFAHLDTWDDIPYQVEDSAYVDMNNDKKLEVVLKMLQTGVDSPGTKWIILNVEDGTVYAYVLNYSGSYQLLENGTFMPSEEFYNYFRIEFDHEQCMTYEVREDGKHDVVIRK